MVAHPLLEQVAMVMSNLMIIIALGISAATTLKLMMRLYRAQAWTLTIVVVITALQPGRSLIPLVALAILPATMGMVVPSLLARAALDRPATSGAALRQSLGKADVILLQHGRPRLPAGVSVAVDMTLIALSVLVAYRFAARSQELAFVVTYLAVTVALVLQGMFTMINKRDIIGQAIGLLVVEHGLFLAAVRVAPPSLAYLFVLGLFFYILVTVIILLWILPALSGVPVPGQGSAQSGRLDVGTHNKLKG